MINQGQVFTNFVEYALGRRPIIKNGRDLRWEVLSCLAFTLNQRHETSIEYNEAVSTITAKVDIDDASAEALIQAIIDDGLMVQVGGTRGAQLLRFAPNLMMQEYFAAEKLKKIATRECQAKLWQPLLLKSWRKFCNEPNLLATIPPEKRLKLILQPSELAPLACDPWWAETFILLASLLADPDERLKRGESLQNVEALSPDWLISKLALKWDALGLAFWCIECGVEVKDEKIKEIVDSVAKNLGDLNPDIRYDTVKTLLVGIYPQYPFPSRLRIELLIEASEDKDLRVAELASEGLQLFNPKDVESVAKEVKQKLKVSQGGVQQEPIDGNNMDLQKGHPTKGTRSALSLSHIQFTVMCFIGNVVGSVFNFLHLWGKATVKVKRIAIFAFICLVAVIIYLVGAVGAWFNWLISTP